MDKARDMKYSFTKDDIVVLGVPVYGGRIPAVLNNVINNLKGDGTKAILVSVYGNRD